MCIFYSPWNHSLQDQINKSKKKYEKIQHSTEKIYQQHIKVFWLNDLNQQTKYYLYAYMMLSLLPFFYVFAIPLLVISQGGMIDSNSIPKVDDIHVFIVQFSLFYTGLQLFIYSVAIKKWMSIIVPIVLFLFIFAIGYFNIPFNLLQTIAIVTLLVLTSITALKISSVFGILVPLFMCFIIAYVGLIQLLIQLGLSAQQQG